MSDTWYYAIGKDRFGPLTLEEIKDMLPTLRNPQDVLVWRDGFSAWTRASDVPGLRAKTIIPPPLPSTGAMIDRADSASGPGPAKPRGIGGWLILPVLGTILTPLYMAYGALRLAADLSRTGGGSLMRAVDSLNPALKPFVLAELGYNIAILAGWVIAIVCAFRHKRWYPGLFVILTALTLFAALAEAYVGTEIFKEPFSDDDAKAIARPLLTLIVWGPYMFLSKRVRNTFIK